MKNKRFHAAAAALFLLASVLSACSGSAETDTQITTGTDNTTTTAADTEPRWKDALPADTDLGGKTVVIHARGNDNTLLEIDTADAQGEVLNDAVYQRNRALEERLNFTLELYAGEGWQNYGSEVTKIRASIAAGDNAWQIISGWGINVMSLVLENCFWDLTDMPYLDTMASWWNQSAIEGLTMGGGRYFLTGDVAFLSLLGGAYVMFVNDKLCETYDIESIPALVRDGSWTMEKMTEITKNVIRDIDGSGTMDEKDLYGLVLDQYNSADSFYTSADIHQITVTDGIPSYTPAEERMAKLMEYAYPLYYNGEMVGSYKTTDVTLQMNMFRGRQALMIIRELDSARSEFREMEDNYTIIPMPKLDAAQENYRTAAYNGAAVWGIPSDNPDTDTALIVMEAMAAETYYAVTPVYFETCLQEKYARNEKTLEMLEIIRETLFLDSEYLWGDTLGNPAYIMRDMISAQKSDVASWIAKKEKQIRNAVEKTVEELENIQNS